MKISGYGPDNVIEELRKLEWTPSVPDGNNFNGIVLAGYVLNDTPDKLAPMPVSVVVKKIGTEYSFRVKGFCFPDLFMGLKAGPPCWGKNKVLGQELFDQASADNPQLYEIEVS